MNVTLSQYRSSRSISSLENTTLSSLSSILLVKDESGTKFNFGRKVSIALSHNFWSYIYRGNILAWKVLCRQLYSAWIFMSLILILNKIKYKRTSIISLIMYSLSFALIRNKLCCRRKSSNSFITHFLDLVEIGKKF